FLDPLAFNQPGNASRHYDQVGTLDVLAQIMGESMGNGGGAARQQQFQRHGAAHDIRGADNDGIEPVQVDTSAFQQRHDAFRRAGAQQGHALGKPADIVGMEAVYILVWTNALEQLRRIQMPRQRQLYEDAINKRIFIELVDQRQQLFLLGLGWQVMRRGFEADFLAVPALVRHIYLRGRIGTYENHG